MKLVKRDFVRRMRRHWATNNFSEWVEWRNGRSDLENVPSDLITNGNAAALNHFLSLYFVCSGN